MARPASAALLAWLACLSSSRLEAATVMILDPSSPSAELTETVSRLHGELLSVGLAATIVNRDSAGGPGGGSVGAWLQGRASEGGIDAAIEVLGNERLEAVDIWVFRPTPPKATVVRLSAEQAGENAPARLAIRAVDRLRSLLIERDLDRPMSVRAAPAAGPAARIGFEVGGAMLTSLDGVGPAILPVVRVDVPAGRRLGVQAELAGFGTRPTVGGPGSSARVAQQYGLLGVCVCAPSTSRVQPVLGLSAGALRTAADGQANAPLEAHSVVQWSFLLEATAGARVRLGTQAHLTLAAHVQVAQPYLAIRVVNAGTATSGRPNLLLTVAVGEWL